ncbi:hypothetical protein LXL04_036638 [Taraxacum kok-saghyz]
MSSEPSNSSSTVTSLPLTTSSLTLVNFPSSLKLLSTNYISYSLQTFIRFQKLVENFFQLKIKIFFRITEVSTSKCRLISPLVASPTSLLLLTLLNTMDMPNVGIDTLSKLLSLYFLMHICPSNSGPTYLINRLPTKTLHNTTPYYQFFQKQPNYDKLRSFGCLAYPWLRPYTNHKLESRSKPCLFVSYSSSQSAYHLLDPLTNKIYTSRHVYFVESEFPYSTLTNTPSTSSPKPDTWLQLNLIPIQNPPTPTPTSPQSTPTPTNSPSNSDTPPTSTSLPQNTSAPSDTQNTFVSSDTQPINTRRNPKPNSKYHNKDFLLYSSTASSFQEPQTIAHALKHPAWRKSMQDECEN